MCFLGFMRAGELMGDRKDPSQHMGVEDVVLFVLPHCQGSHVLGKAKAPVH